MGSMKDLDLATREMAEDKGVADAKAVLSAHSSDKLLNAYAFDELYGLLSAPLSGEYADSYTPAMLGEALGLGSDQSDLLDELCDVFDDVYFAYALAGIERALHVPYPHPYGRMHVCAGCELGPCQCEGDYTVTPCLSMHCEREDEE